MATSAPSLSVGRAAAPGIRVLIADETLMGCQLLTNALTRSRFRFDVVACATNCREILDSLREHPADIVLVSESLEQGPLTGFQALHELHASFPAVRAIMLLKAAPQDLVVDAFRAGAKGVVCRTEPLQVLGKCIRTVYKGEIWANCDQLHFILQALMSSTPLRVVNPKGRHLLTQREDEIANLVTEGMTNREIAQKLGIAEHTVGNSLFRIYEKLGISSRVELALYTIHQKQS